MAKRPPSRHPRGRRDSVSARQRTDVAAGEVWAVPVRDEGFFPIVVARVTAPDAPVPLAFTYLWMRPSRSLPRAADIPPLASWEHAWISLMTLRPFAQKRWKRIGVVPGFNSADWPILPNADGVPSPSERTPEIVNRSLCSIEVTRDEPTFSLLDNKGVSLAEAEEFPRVDCIHRASSLEETLRTHVRNTTNGATETLAYLTRIDGPRLRQWTAYANEIRSRHADRVDPGTPPGRATDRSVKPGTWFGLPMAGGGFGAALVVRRSAGVVIFGDAAIYAFAKRFDFFPTFDDVRHLKAKDADVVTGTSLSTVADGRWRVIGEDPSFDQEQWPFPYGWTPASQRAGSIHVSVRVKGKSTTVEVRLSDNVLKQVPQFQNPGNCMSAGSGIELELGRATNSTYPEDVKYATAYRRSMPRRLRAWRNLNAAIDAALQKRFGRSALGSSASH